MKQKKIYRVFSTSTYAGEPCDKRIEELKVVGEDKESFYIEVQTNVMDYVKKDEIDKDITRFVKFFGCYTSLEKVL